MTDLTFTRTQQFTAQGATSVNWSVDGVPGGNASTGTITSTGLYTPPASVGTHTVTATTPDQSQSVSATVYVTNYAGTFTYHNDIGRTGENLNEIALTPADVNQSTFGKLFSYPLDGLTLASPLYVANVNIPGKGYHNVVYVATEHDSVYAFDADGLSSTPLWHDSFIDPANGITPVPAADTGETGDIPNEIGITSTPVIDPTTGTLYVDAATKEVSGGTTTYYHKLHALDIATGAEKFGSPVTIQASVPGTGMGSQGGTLTFVPLRQNQRTALLLSNGVVYLGFSSRGDIEPFHGWVLGYNATTLQQVMVYCTTPNGDDGGVWMSGDGVAADSAGSLYFITGDGLFDASSGGNDYGDSFVKMNAAGTRPRLLLAPGAVVPELRQSRSRLGRSAAAARSTRSPPPRDGRRRQERHDLPRRSGQHGALPLEQRPDRPVDREHLDQGHGRGERASSARPSTSTAASTSARSRTRSRPSS